MPNSIKQLQKLKKQILKEDEFLPGIHLNGTEDRINQINKVIKTIKKEAKNA